MMKKFRFLGVRLTEELYGRIKEVAVEKGNRKESETVRELLEEGLKHYHKVTVHSSP